MYLVCANEINVPDDMQISQDGLSLQVFFSVGWYGQWVSWKKCDPYFRADLPKPDKKYDFDLSQLKV
jgi:hypothetical protein